MNSTPNIRFVFGFRSPYAWLANSWLEANLDSQALEGVTFIPYWNPRADTLARLEAGQGEFLYREMSRDRHMYILADIRRLAAKFSHSVTWPGETPDADWEAPHRIYLAAL